MNPMSEYSKNTAVNANNTPNTAVTPELESPFLAPEALGSEQVVQAAEMGLDIAAEPLSFDEPVNPPTQLLPNPIQTKQSGNWWSRQSLKAKATLAAILIGTMPVAVTGAAAWLVANQAVTTQVEAEEMATAEDLQDKVNLFMRSRAQDIQVMAARTVFTDAKRRTESTAQEKGQVLDEMLQAYGGAYASIAAFDLNGNLMAQTQGDALENQSNEAYFQAALKSEAPVVGFPTISAAAGDFSMYAATTIKDSITGKPVGVIRGRIPVVQLDTAIRNYAKEGSIAYYLIDSEGKAFLTSPGAVQITEEKPILPILEVFPGLESLRSAAKADAAVLDHGQFSTEQYLAYLPSNPETDPLNLGWSVVIATPTEVAFASQRQLGLTLILGTLVAGAGVAVLATLLANRATRPVLLASEAVQKLGQGDLETRIEVSGTDEMAILGSNINLMAGQIQNLLVEQEQAAQEQLAAQAEIAAQQAKAAQEQLEAKEFLQNRALELLMEVSPLRNGDLTIRANVTEDEIGTIADSYNATILSLRKLVTQVQAAAAQVTATADQSEGSVQELSAEALQQADSIQVALERITEMTTAIQSVTRNAKTAEMVVQAASQSVLEGDQAMNKTVEGILAIRETVAETSKKVKQLGESSQKISKVVNLISSFADQTNLLALNASIEAARAGEEGRGFAVVADEVRSLARQSAKATADIEALVAEIQTETNEVVTAMETGTQQVVTGTQLVEETRQRLTQITEASETITALVQSIAQATIQQSQASEQVSATMTDVAGIATNTSGRAGQVLEAFKDLLNVAQDLQGTVGQFKLQ